MCGLPPPSSDFGPEMTRSGFAFPLALRSTRVDSTPRSLSNGRRFWHEDGEPAADYANYADADVRPNGQLAGLHPRNSRNPRLVPSKKVAETRSRRTSRQDFPRRGEIFLTALDPALGHEIKKTRPALVIQNFDQPGTCEALIAKCR